MMSRGYKSGGSGCGWHTVGIQIKWNVLVNLRKRDHLIVFVGLLKINILEVLFKGGWMACQYGIS